MSRWQLSQRFCSYINYKLFRVLIGSTGTGNWFMDKRWDIEFVTRKIKDGIAQIALWKKDKIVLGYLEAKLDWVFVTEYVNARE